jgi:cytochrome P450
MALYPDVFNKARKEIDIIVGTERLPSLLDKTNLRYVDAVIQEVFRWNPIAPLGM